MLMKHLRVLTAWRNFLINGRRGKTQADAERQVSRPPRTGSFDDEQRKKLRRRSVGFRDP
jgi:hypothetical protein